MALTSSIVRKRKRKGCNILRMRFNASPINGNGFCLFGDPLRRAHNILRTILNKFRINGTGFCLFDDTLPMVLDILRIRFNAFPIRGNGFCLFGNPLPQIYSYFCQYCCQWLNTDCVLSTKSP